MQVSVDFYGEVVKLGQVKTWEEFKKRVSAEFLLPETDVSELNFRYKDSDGDEISIKNASDYDILIKSGDIILIKVEVSEKSQLYQEEKRKMSIASQIKNTVDKLEIPQKVEKVKGIIGNCIQGAIDFFKTKPKVDSNSDKTLKKEVKKPKKIISKIVKKVVKKKIVSRKPQAPKTENKEIKENKEMNKTSVAEHKEIICDGCEKCPIVGIRYRCTVCDDFDYCEDCEKKFALEHGHPMLKIRKPELDPIDIHCTMKH